jgi:multidrug efflux pump subunit AcrA (membrane-fusion protein)
VGPDNAVRYQEVQLGRDYGQDVEILHGLAGNERLIQNPTENLVDGVKVEPTEPPVKTVMLTGPSPAASETAARQ